MEEKSFWVLSFFQALKLQDRGLGYTEHMILDKKENVLQSSVCFMFWRCFRLL